MPEMSRRSLLSAAVLLAAGAFIPGCRPLRSTDGGSHAAHLAARPGSVAANGGTGHPAGQRPLGLVAERDALLYVPGAPAGSGAPAAGPLPLLVVLHGAGGDAARGLSPLSGLADEFGIALMSPASRTGTWDAIRGSYEDDVEQIDAGLEETFSTLDVDPGRIGIAGFSDGASYALGLGLANGDLFSKILAFSPGFIPSGPRGGKPDVFISHGRADDVLPIRSTSRRIVPSLEGDGYSVTYREFDGGHAVPPEVAREALDWLGW